MYFKSKKKQDLKNILIVAAIVAAFTWFIVSQITATIIEQAAKPGAKDIPEDFVDPAFDPKPITNDLYADVNKNYWDQFMGYDSSAYSNALNLSSAELAMVYNDWTDRYFTEDQETLTQALEGHNIYGNSGEWNEAKTLRDQLVERLKSIDFL